MVKDILSTNKGGKGQKKFKIDKGPNKERDVDIDVVSGNTDDVFTVEKLNAEKLVKTMVINGKTEAIEWFNNFGIKKNDEYINQSYNLKITGLSDLKKQGKNIVIIDGNSSDGEPYVFNGKFVDTDTIELTDGDPAVGSSPP